MSPQLGTSLLHRLYVLSIVIHLHSVCTKIKLGSVGRGPGSGGRPEGDGSISGFSIPHVMVTIGKILNSRLPPVHLTESEGDSYKALTRYSTNVTIYQLSNCVTLLSSLDL